jgi:NADPH-dependent glutamate synthase beta subunit-like oxidoreductase
VGEDVTIGQLREEGFRAFCLAIGTQECIELGVEGEGLDGVHHGLDYLRQARLGEPVALGKRVAVIGGGNVAMDAARSARRMGAEDTFILYRRSLEEMPSRAEEIEECQEEGIGINVLTQPVRLIGENGRVTAIECIKTRLGEPDESGRPRPEPIPDSEFTVEVDGVITALGQEADWSCLTPECACTLADWGTINVDPLTLQTDDPDIFAAGDAVTGLGTVVEAIADGRQASISIDRYLRGEDLQQGRERAWIAITEPQKEQYDPAVRAQMPRLEPEARLDNFNEVQQGFTEEMVGQQAKRCISCGSACVQACPYGVIQFSAEEGKSHKCDLCTYLVHLGDQPLCAQVCLTDAIAFGELELLRQRAVEQGHAEVGELSRESVLYVK